MLRMLILLHDFLRPPTPGLLRPLEDRLPDVQTHGPPTPRCYRWGKHGKAIVPEKNRGNSLQIQSKAHYFSALFGNSEAYSSIFIYINHNNSPY
jgi:hypothetical protein